MKRVSMLLLSVAIVVTMISQTEAHTVKNEPVKMSVSPGVSLSVAVEAVELSDKVYYTDAVGVRSAITVSFIPEGVYTAIRKADDTKRKAQTGCGYDSAGVYYCCDASGHCYAAKDPNKKKSIRIK